MRLREVGELEFIRRVRTAMSPAGGPITLGIGDDAAVLAPEPGSSLLLKCDAAVEGRHFRREWFAPAEIGARAALSAISDIAAMGGRPVALLLTLLVSPEEEVAVAQEIVRGVAEAGDAFGAHLAGGETIATEGPLAVDVIVAGFVSTGHELRRGSARPGDVLLVSGTVGDSAAGLACLQHGLTDLLPAQHVISRYQRPQPRVGLGRLLVESGLVRAAIDISDGLLRDARHLATESGVAITIERDALPVSPEARDVAQALAADLQVWAASGGEDYELLFTAPPDAVPDLVSEASSRLGLAITRIGGVVEGEGVRVRAADGSDWAPPAEGWDQFTRG